MITLLHHQKSEVKEVVVSVPVVYQRSERSEGDEPREEAQNIEK
jgi:hypothetical protein